MIRSALICGALASLMVCGWASSGSAAQSKKILSYLPKSGLAQFIVDKFDIGSIDSALGPRRDATQHSFASVGMKVSDISKNEITLEDAGLLMQIDILARGDGNDDGVEDVTVCLTEEVTDGGTLYDRTPYYLTRYSADSPLIAISAMPDPDTCKPNPPLSGR